MRMNNFLFIAVLLSSFVAFAGTYPTADDPAPPIVVVHWRDITSVDNWNYAEEAFMVELYTLGWLIDETDSSLTIATCWDQSDGEWRILTMFPKGAIVEVTRSD